MNLKWYYSTFIVAVALFFGVYTQHQNIAPNQEIVLQFSENTSALNTANRAISAVKLQLKKIGAENIQVNQNEEGVLKISYYSTSDVERIKQILAQDQSLKFEHKTSKENHSIPAKVPSEDQNIACNFDVYEIQNGHDIAFEHAGKVAVELKASSHHFNNPSDNGLGNIVFYAFEFPSVQTAGNFYKNVALAIDYKSNKIPEVRAGPVA